MFVHAPASGSVCSVHYLSAMFFRYGERSFCLLFGFLEWMDSNGVTLRGMASMSIPPFSISRIIMGDLGLVR
jgi:hypothetical protein